MKIVETTLHRDELKTIAAALFGTMVKAVVDIERRVIALDAELHADLESVLLAHGSAQAALWGINLYPDLQGEDFVEFDSLINVRPSHGNRSRGVENAETRTMIMAVVAERIVS